MPKTLHRAMFESLPYPPTLPPTNPNDESESAPCEHYNLERAEGVAKLWTEDGELKILMKDYEARNEAAHPRGKQADRN